MRIYVTKTLCIDICQYRLCLLYIIQIQANDYIFLFFFRYILNIFFIIVLQEIFCLMIFYILKQIIVRIFYNNNTNKMTISQISYMYFFVAQNCIKKGIYVELYLFYFKKLSRNLGKFSSTALLQSNVTHKKCITSAVLEN